VGDAANSNILPPAELKALIRQSYEMVAAKARRKSGEKKARSKK